MQLALATTALDTPAPDTDLVSRATTGDVDAFESLYRQHVGRIHAVCLRLTANPALAEELTQEAFLRAWRKLSSFRGDAKFSSWLHRLAVNVVLSHHRARSRRRLGLVPLEDAAEPAAPPKRDSASALDLEDAIAGLPERARWVFVLHEVEGYRHEEIANMTGTTVGTSKAHLHRARKLLREALTS